MTREEKLQKAHQMFDNRNLLTELKWQRNYFNRGYVSKQEELFNLWIFDECIKTLEQEPKTGHWIMTSNYLTTAYGSIDYVKCSCCGEDSLEEGDYCPNCGADMRGEEE